MIAWLEQAQSDNLTSYLAEATGLQVSSLLKMYFSYLEGAQGDDLTKFEYAKTAAQAFQSLVLERLIPAHVTPSLPASIVRSVKNPRKRKALADLPQLNDEPAVSTILGKIAEIDDSAAAARILREHLGEQHSNVVMEVRSINSSRLMRARDAYSAVFEAKWQDYELACRAIAAAGGWPEAIERDLLDAHAMQPGPYFGLSLESLGLLIILIDVIGSGLPQSRKDERCRREFKYFTKEIRRSKLFSGFDFERIATLYYPTFDAMAALAGVIMVDAGCNISTVARIGTTFGQILDDHPGFRRLWPGMKARSDRWIENDLPITRSDGRVSIWSMLERAMELTSFVRAKYFDSDVSECLLLAKGRSGWNSVSTSQIAEQLISIHHKASIKWEGFEVRQLRAAKLLELELSSDRWGIRLAQATANHARPKTSMGYTRHIATVLQYEEAIRRFQDSFQWIIASDIGAVAKKLRVSEATAAASIAAAKETGLGTLCLNRLDGAQLGVRRGEHCDRVEGCANGCQSCVVLLTPETVADLVLLKRKLEEDGPKIAAEYPDRWANNWLPWYALCCAALETAGKGAAERQILNAGRKLGEERGESAPNFVLPW